MLIFLDTEFTDFAKPELISIGLVAEDGREFYAERTDYHRANCNDFVKETVLPLLGRIRGAACDSQKLTGRLRKWFEQLPEPSIIVFDFESDWQLLTNAAIGRMRQTLPPTNFGKPLHLDSDATASPIFNQALNFTYTQQWPPHHALADARALMAGYRAWCLRS